MQHGEEDPRPALETEGARQLVNSAKFATVDSSPSGMSLMQSGAGFIVIAGLLWSAMRYYNRDNRALNASTRKTG